MSDEIVPVGSGGQLTSQRQRAAELVRAFLSARRKATLDAYKRDLGLFAEFLGVGSVDEAAWALFSLPQGDANAVVLRFRQKLQESGMGAATVNRRLAAIRSLSKLARMLGVVPWTIEVPDLRVETYRDTRGPGAEGFRKMLAVLDGKTDAQSLRNRAILRLLYDLGLRRFEVTGLLLGHLDLAGRRLWVLGKARDKREPVTVPEVTFGALCDWLRVHPGIRSAQPGQNVAHVPLFVSLDNSTFGHSLSNRSVNRIVSSVGASAGLHVWPHGLRHAAITEALDATGGDVRRAQRFARHRNPATTLRYDDNRADLAGQVADLVSKRSKG